MGIRQEVKLIYGNEKTEEKPGNEIFIYSHWDDAKELKEIIKEVLQRKERWGDESYLARMIFSAIVKRDINSATGFGLAPYGIGDYEPVVINLEEQTVDGIAFINFINN